MYPENGAALISDDLRSHVSHFSNTGGSKLGKTRSIADGQSQHSFSNHSGRYLANSAFPSNLVSSRSGIKIKPIKNLNAYYSMNILYNYR